MNGIDNSWARDGVRRHPVVTLEPESRTITLPTGILTLAVNEHDLRHGESIDSLCDFAARANPKRGFLVVSKVLGRHLPVRPDRMRAIMRALAQALPDDLPQPIVLLGMAETATALGQGIFAAFQELHPGAETVYLQSSRQTVADARTIARFEEGHSHATSHLVQVRDPLLEAEVRAARSLIIVDDECSTGSTFVAAARAMAAVLPRLERAATCCITDWSHGGYLTDMPVPAAACSLLSGGLTWQAGEQVAAPQLSATSNGTGLAPATGMGSRCGLRRPEAARRERIVATPGERVLVLGDGEHAYEALRIGEEVEAQGGIAAIQSITRTPALLGQAMQTCSNFTNADRSGAPAFLYNILAHRPQRIIIAAEQRGQQVEDTERALGALGASCRVELAECRYQPEPTPSC